jgi:hypothetical protein
MNDKAFVCLCCTSAVFLRESARGQTETFVYKFLGCCFMLCAFCVFGERRLVVLERVKDWVSGTNGRGLTFEMRTGVCSVSSWVTWFSSLLDMLGLAMTSMLARLMIVVRPWKIARLKTF